MARARIALATLTVALAATSAPAPAAVPEGATFTDEYFMSADGVTRLHADVMRPKGVEGKVPVILSVGPYFNHTGQTGATGAVSGEYDPTATGPNDRFKDMYTEGKIFQKGYAYVQVDLRGFGASSGCNDFGGAGEQADVKAAVEWAASQPWSTGKVGMWGKSYDGWTEVMGLATKPKGLAAAVIQSPIIDGYRTLYMNGIHYGNGWYLTPGLYQQQDLVPSSVLEPEQLLNGSLNATPTCYATNILLQDGLSSRDDALGFWKERDLVPRAKGSNVPVLWSHGFVDANTKPDNFLDIWSTLSGPHRAWFGQYPHVRPQDKDEKNKSVVGREGFIDEAMRWFDRYLKDDASAKVENDPGVEVEDGGLQKYRAEAAWPPADATPSTLALTPGEFTNQQGNDGDAGGGALVGGGSTGKGLWSVSQALPYDVHIAGVPKLSLKLDTPTSNLHAVLYDIDAKGKAVLVSRAGAALAAGTTSKEVELYPQDWTFVKGHRIALLLAESDDQWFAPEVYSNQATTVLPGSTLSLPFLKYTRTAFLESRPTQAEKERPDPFEVAADVLGRTAQLTLPPDLVDAPVVTLPTTKTAKKRPKFSAALKRTKAKRVLRASGVAPTGTKVTLRLRQGTKTLQTKTVQAVKGSYRATFKVRKAGRYRVVATIRSAGTTVRTRSQLVRIR